MEAFDSDRTGKLDLLQSALKRELVEEAVIKAKVISRDYLGLVYIETDDPVNSMHVGLMYLYTLDGPDVSMKEHGLDKVGWVTAKYLKEHMSELTYWSRTFVKTLP